MKTALSDKTHIVILSGDIRIWLSAEEFGKLKVLLETGKTFFNVSDRIFNAKNVIYAGARNEIDMADRVKRGEWQCKSCERWHSRNEECGCQGGKY